MIRTADNDPVRFGAGSLAGNAFSFSFSFSFLFFAPALVQPSDLLTSLVLDKGSELDP
jgi:hypothetical protein